MADSVAAQFKPAQGMSLSDMAYMANSVQQYQQAQQLNPLQLETAKTNLSRLQEFTPLELRTKAADAAKAEGTLQPSIDLATQQAETARIEGLKAQYGLDKDQHADFAKLLGGFQYDPRLDPENLAKNPNDAVDVMHDIQAQAKAMNIPDKKIAVITAPGMAKAMQDPKTFPDYLKNMTMTGMTAAEQRSAGLEKTQVTPSGQVERTTPAIYGQQQQVNIEQPGGNAPMPGIVKINGIYHFITAPKTPGGQPTLQPVPVGNQPQETPIGKSATKQNVSAAGQQAEPLMRLDKFTAPGQFTEQEKSRWSAGQTDFANANQMAKESSNSDLAISQLRHTLNQAAGSKTGQIVRAAGQAVFGNPEYDTFLKNIAEQQVRQASMMGLDTKYAQQDLATANGSGNVSQEALAHILDRADATNLAVKKYAAGYSMLQNKVGKDTAYLNNDNYKAAFSQNHDPVAFIIQSVNRSNQSPQQKQETINYYLNQMSDADKGDLVKKQKSLKRLERGDY
jgi:hypothetical protein